jgi:ATP-binding cassette subfamily B protein
MDIITRLLERFFYEEILNTFLLIFFSFLVNLFQTNGVSYTTAKIIYFIQKGNTEMVWEFYKWFIIISSTYILLFNFYKFFQNKLMAKLRQWIRRELLKLILLINNESFLDMNFTKLSAPINRVSYVCYMIFSDVVTFLIPNITFLIILTLYFFFKNTIFGLLFLIGNILFLASGLYTWDYMKNTNNNFEVDLNDVESYQQEILNNIDKIIYRGEARNEMNIFFQKSENTINSAFLFFDSTMTNSNIMGIILHAVLFICSGYLIYLYFHKKIEITIFITFFTMLLLYRDKMIGCVYQMSEFVEFFGRSSSVLKHFQSLTDKGDSIDDILNKKHDDVELSFDTIRFENVTFKYNSTTQNVMENFNMFLRTNGKIIGIVGLSGKGKSTFAKMLIKLYKPITGNIYIDEHDIDNISPEYIRQNITYVNQNTKLFDRKVVENILYGCNDMDVCKNHMDNILNYPKILELYGNMDINSKKAGALGEHLSGGQRQIVNVIGGLINPSKILILDEPTNALDGNLKKELLEIIMDFKKHKKCIIIISHDEECMKIFDEKVKL